MIHFSMPEIQIHSIIKAAVHVAPAIAPGAVTIAADWMGLINTALSVALMSLSIAFLLWRWRVAYLREQDNKGES